MDNQPCIFLGIKVKPGPIERFKIENFDLENTVNNLKTEAEKKANVPSTSLELIHHGKILKDDATLHDSGIKNGEMVHVVKKKSQPPPAPAPNFTDAELQQLNSSLRTLGCTPNAPGWTRAMQLLNDESAMSEILEQAPALAEDCVALSILHEVELVAALGATVQSMRRGATAHPSLPAALTALTQLVRSRSDSSPSADNAAPVSGFAYSLEALSEDEEDEEPERPAITQEQLAAALQAATEAVASPSSRGNDGLLRLLREARSNTDPASPSSASSGARATSTITPEMLGDAISAAIGRSDADTTAASSSQGPAPRDEDFSSQLQHMHEMGLLNDALNVRALLICSGDVNAAINLVFSGAIGDD